MSKKEAYSEEEREKVTLTEQEIKEVLEKTTMRFSGGKRNESSYMFCRDTLLH